MLILLVGCLGNLGYKLLFTHNKIRQCHMRTFFITFTGFYYNILQTLIVLRSYSSLPHHTLEPIPPSGSPSSPPKSMPSASWQMYVYSPHMKESVLHIHITLFVFPLLHSLWNSFSRFIAPLYFYKI